MNAVRYKRVKEIFEAAADRSGLERNRFLDDACGEDTELRTEVESLLSHDESSGGFLEEPALHAGLDELISTRPMNGMGYSSRPERIGRYTILDELGKGGMGVVYLARQDNPRREVALKVIRPGIASAEMLRRFEYEAQLLGRLHHPGIAQIYEAGTADTGDGVQPFYAMELIQGQPLGQYLREHTLDVRQKLQLMIRICDAVHHAHQKGIIHRDLKPGNILVEDEVIDELRVTSDESAIAKTHSSFVTRHSSFTGPMPKVLDFGVARAIGADDRRTISTSAGQLIGTISYMSPEQVTGDPHDLDTRSDVYALGVIAFEMLTGKRPHKLEDKSLPECSRIIRDEEPTKLGALDRTLRGDLETIISKALEKDKVRRYQSASELARDFERFLRHEPIAARRPTLAYQTRKFVRRHPATVVVFVVIVLSAVAVFHFVSQAQLDRVRKGWAEQTLKDLAIMQGQAGDIDTLRPVHQDLERLGRIAALVDVELASQPEIAAKLRTQLGENYLRLKQLADADEQFTVVFEYRQSSNAGDELIGEALQNVARVRYEQGRFEEAEGLYQQALERRVRALGKDHKDVAMTKSHIAASLRRQGRYAEAEQWYRDALETRQRLTGDDRDALVGASHNGLALLYSDLGRWNEAAEQFDLALNLARTRAKPDDLRIAISEMNLAKCLILSGDFTQAEALLQEALDVQTRKLPGDHPHVALTLLQLARLRQAQGSLAEAEQLARQALAIQTKLLPADHIDLAESQLVLGSILLDADMCPEAARLLDSSVRIRSTHVANPHWLVAHTQSLLGESMMCMGEFGDAEPLLVQSQLLLVQLRGADDPTTQSATERLARLYEETGRKEQAASLRPDPITPSP